jgi:hypothetical protein
LGLRGRKQQETGENWMMMSFVMCIHFKYDFGDQTKKDEMSKGVTCGGEKCVQGLGWETCRKETTCKT